MEDKVRIECHVEVLNVSLSPMILKTYECISIPI